jgi:hypothetical protein
MIVRQRKVQERFALSVVLVVGQISIAVFYLFPGFLAPARPTTTVVVVALGAVGPIWTAWFGLTGLGLFAALIAHRLLHVAHAATASSWLGFGFALVVGAVATGGTYLLPAASLLLGAVNLVVAASYSRDEGRGRPE